MPTPFQHLIYAERVFCHPALPPVIHDVLAEVSGAYLLGNVAPDVQSVTGQRRFETHFYGLDRPREPSAAERLLAAHPELRDPRRLPFSQAAFVSGYLVHLAWDEVWMWDIFLPYFRNGPSFRRDGQDPDDLSYFLHHNALRACLDRKAYAALRSSDRSAELLRRVSVDPRLPFVRRDALAAWRDLIVDQLEDPAKVRTMEVFARRMRVPVQRLSELVEAMVADTYDGVPGLEAALVRYERRGLVAAQRVLLRYWEIEDRLDVGAQGCLEPGCIVS